MGEISNARRISATHISAPEGFPVGVNKKYFLIL
jgi:hypothetical protein